MQSRPGAGAILFVLICLMTLWVFLLVEMPLLLGMNPAWTEKIRPYEELLHLHAVCGVAALLAGATQFSSEWRRTYPRLHRMAGYVYVGTTALASPLAIWVALQYTPMAEATAHVSQALIWVVTTVAAFLAIRSRHMPSHQTWMVRSYALTLTFVLSRFVTEVLEVRIPADAGGNATFVWLSTILVLLAADTLVDWNRRA
ncbi:MAG TPA: DUF2306 domain-containing protein [Ramlibacter sp.]|uniref:DUF2306 domain-containing protein n=1 Tax=Ramlibacter sp. TaxID=1917967 RepID=UPI002ED3D009